MNTYKNLITHLKNNVSEDKLLGLHNEMSQENNPDDYIFSSIEEIAELLGDTPADFARRVFFGSVQSWNDNYFFLNGYANIESAYSLDDSNSPFSYGDLAEYIVENRLYDEIGLDEDEDEDEDEEN